jgi:hypothetical protein
VVGAGVGLAEPVQEIGGRDVQCTGELDNGCEPRIPAGAFKQPDLGAMEVAEVAERLLAEPGSHALGTQVSRRLPRRPPAGSSGRDDKCSTDKNSHTRYATHMELAPTRKPQAVRNRDTAHAPDGHAAWGSPSG